VDTTPEWQAELAVSFVECVDVSGLVPK